MNLYQEAIEYIRTFHAEAVAAQIPEPSAITLATVNALGYPSIRTVLLRQIDERGLVFYTNTRSRKGQQLAHHPHAALCLFWELIGKQITVEGRVEPVTPAEADAYWQTRPRESQIGAWASQQSERLDNRDALVKAVAHFTTQFANQAVPRPPHWSGYRVIPTRIEFWFRGDFRLHERICYEQNAHQQWQRDYLNP